MRNVLLLHQTKATYYVTNYKKKTSDMYNIYDFTKGGIEKTRSTNGLHFCKQQQKKKKGKRKKSDVALAFFPDMSRVNCQLIYAMNTRDINTKSFEFCGELMISFIKPHMNNQITIACLSSNFEESIGIYLDQTIDILISDPPPTNDCKVQACRVCQKTKHSPGYQKVIYFLRKVNAGCRKYDHHLCRKHKFVISQT